MAETKEVQKCAWCGRTGNMQFASKRPPRRYFCNEICLRKWDWINGGSQNWPETKEKNYGKKES